MESNTAERIKIEQNLSMVLGRSVRLSSPEIRTLTRADLKRAYFRKAKETHPDRAASIGIASSILEERFRLLQNAYDLLQENWDSVLDGSAVRQAESEARFRRNTEAKESPRPRAGQQHTAQQTQQRNQQQAQAETAHDRTDKARNSQQRSRQDGTRQSTAHGKARSGAERTGSRTRTDKTDARKTGSAQAGAAQKSAIPQARMLPPIRLRLGEYLYYTGRIDWAAFFAAISWQFRNRPTIGSLAVQLGLLDQSAILSIIRRRRQGELFGEAAVRLGYLETWDIMILCGRQKLLNCPIGKYFIEEGILSEKEIAESLDGLSRHNLFVALRSRKAN